MPRPRQPRTQSKPEDSSKPIPTPEKDNTPTSVTTLPSALEISYPNFQAQLPTDWYRPSSSSVPRITDADFQTEAQIAQEQGNAHDLQGMNLDNVEKLVRNAVKATKIGKLVAEYLIGLEEIKAVGVKLRNAQTATTNEEIRVQITQEKGNQLTQQLAAEKLRTDLEKRKSDLISVDIDGYTKLLPVKETEWQNKITAAQQKAQLALQSSSRN